MPIQVPDLIRNVATKAGLDLDSSDFQVGTGGAVPPELVQAYQTGDYATIQQYTDTASNDLNPIYGNIQNNADGAFFQVTNPSDGVDYWLSIGGPASNPTGYMWAYCPENPALLQENGKKGASSGPVSQPVAQFGTYSVNASTLGISNQLWDNSLAQLTAASIATVVMTTVAKFIKNRIIGMATQDATEAAVAEGGAELVAEGVVEVGIWTSIGAFVGGLVVGFVAGAIVFYLVMFIINFVYRAYKVAFNIYNWDVNTSYVINDSYTDNAVIDGGGSWTTIDLPSAAHTIKMPDGLVVPTKDTIYQYAAIIYDNDSQVFQGLGAGLQVMAADGSTGFQLKYLCSRFSDNTLGLTGGITESIADYYNDSNTWAPAESYSAQSTIPGSNVPISATTTALGGQSDYFYQYDVHIGLKPSNQLGDPRPKPPKRQPPQMPGKVVMPKPGDEVRLPDGKKAKVVSSGVTKK